MLSIIIALAERGEFNAPFAIIFSPWMVFTGWRARRKAQQYCDRIAPVNSTGAGHNRACYHTFRIGGGLVMIAGVVLFCIAAWQLLST
jgi:hypothetical protein